MKFGKNLTKPQIQSAVVNKDKSKKKDMSKADKAKIGVMVVIGAVSALEFAGIPTISTVKALVSGESINDDPSDAYASLQNIAQDTTSAARNSNLPNVENNISLESPSSRSSSTEPVSQPSTVNKSAKDEVVSSSPVNNKQTPIQAGDLKSKEVPSFVVAPDYRTVLAAVQMIQNAMNPDVEKDWVNVRLQLNAEREKNRLAQVKLQRVKAQADTAKYQQETSEMLRKIQKSQSEDDEKTLTNNVNVEIISIGEDILDLALDGRPYYSRSLNSVVQGMEIVAIDAEKGCATLKMQTSEFQSFCI